MPRNHGANESVATDRAVSLTVRPWRPRHFNDFYCKVMVGFHPYHTKVTVCTACDQLICVCIC
jgi:hypothetical protein